MFAMAQISLIESEQLILDIEEAFSRTQYPGDEMIVYDNSGFHLECQKIKEDFKGKDWRALPLNLLKYHAEGLFFFTDESFRFYLPAYLIASIRFYSRVDIIPHMIVRSLTAPKEQGPRMEQFTNRINKFNQSQKTVIRKFIIFLRNKSTDISLHKEIDTVLETL